MNTFRFTCCALTMVAVAVLGGCGGGQTGGLSNGISGATAPYAVLDLASGKVTWRLELDDVAASPAYRDQQMVFRRIGTGANECLVGVFEVTQAQWQRLDASTPWLTVSTTVVPATAHADGRPLYGIDFDTLVSAVVAYSPTGPARLSLPTAGQWQLAAGTTSGWTWGATTSRAQLDSNAWVHETVGATAGPRTVGSRSASPLGFFDLHGNVWEWTSDGRIHGGSWCDGWQSSRVEAAPAAAQGIDTVLEHALIGARLVLTP